MAASDDKAVTLNFVNADLPAVIKAAAEITGRDVLIDPRVTGTVTIITPKPVPRSLVWSIMLSAIRAQGFTAVGSEAGVARIVPEADAKFFGGPVGRQRGAGDQIVTEVFVLENERAQQLVPVLRPLMSPNNVVNAAPAANALIVTDYAENLERIRRVIAEVDRPASGEIIAIQLKHAAAADFMQIVQRLVPDAAATAAAQGAAARVALAVDPRTNSILVRADNPTLAARIRSLASTLDSPSSQLGNIHVVYLRNADATRLADALRALHLRHAEPVRGDANPECRSVRSGARWPSRCGTRSTGDAAADTSCHEHGGGRAARDAAAYLERRHPGRRDHPGLSGAELARHRRA